MASFIGSIDLRQTRVPIVIPFVVTGVFEVIQLFLGSDPFIVLFSMIGILVTFLPLHFNGRDLYSICAMLFGIRYLGAALILKTFYRQPLQSHLFAPFASHAWVMVLMVVFTAIIILVRRLDRGVDTFAFPNDPRSLRRLALVSFCLGAGALVVVTHKAAEGSASSLGAVGIIATVLQNFLFLAFAAEAARSLEVSRGRNLFSPFLIGMSIVSFLAISALNARGMFLNCVTAIVLVGFMYKAIRWRYVVVGLIFVTFFASFMTPLILYTRFQRGLPIPKFIEYTMETAYKAATDSGFRKYMKDVAEGKSEDINDVEYDYFGDRSNVGNRLSFIALFDSVYQASKGAVPIGIRSFRQSMTGVMPGFMGFDKNPESLGDWLGWQVGLLEAGEQPFINFGLPMEGYASWGWIGIIIYPFLFFFPYLWVFTKIASFRLAVPVSIFVFTSIQLMVETTSDGYMNGITRTAVAMAAFLYVLRYLLFGGRAHVSPLRPAAQTSGAG